MKETLHLARSQYCIPKRVCTALHRGIRDKDLVVIAVCRPSLALDTGRSGLVGDVCRRMNDAGSSCKIANEEVSGVDCRYWMGFVRVLMVFEALSLVLRARVGRRGFLPGSLPSFYAVSENSMRVEWRSSQSKG